MDKIADMDVKRRLDQLRTYRVRKERDTGIQSVVADAAESAQRTHTRLGALAELWQMEMPDGVVRGTALTALRGGVLHVVAESSAVAFEVDRRLREGAEARIRQRHRGTLLKIKVRVGRIDD